MIERYFDTRNRGAARQHGILPFAAAAAAPFGQRERNKA
jgi:hypothetical protein